MRENAANAPTQTATFEVTLDGELVRMPLQGKSLSAIRFHLEMLAMEQSRVLASFKIDGVPASPASYTTENLSFRHIDAETAELSNRPSQILGTALEQIMNARAMVETAVTQVLINDAPVSREIWWNLARKLKDPLLILGMLPDANGWQTPGCAPLSQVRRWQLEQLACIMREVDEACWQDTSALSNALENRALPWLDDLERTVSLWHQTVLAGDRLEIERERQRVEQLDLNCPVLIQG